MIIYTSKGTTIQTRDDARPQWSDLHKRYYVAGYRLIKSRNTFSTVALMHNFEGYSEDQGVCWNTPRTR